MTNTTPRQKPNPIETDSSPQLVTPADVDDRALSRLERAAQYALTCSRRFRESASRANERMVETTLRLLARRRLAEHETMRQRLVLEGRNVDRAPEDNLEIVTKETLAADHRQSVSVLENLYRKIAQNTFDPSLSNLASRLLHRIQRERELNAKLLPVGVEERG